MAKSNVPAESISRGIQRSHRRRFRSGKVTTVNPGVKKRPVITPRRTVAPRPTSAVTKSKPSIAPTVSFPIKLRWTDVLTKDIPNKAALLKEEKEEAEKRLRPGERYALAIKKVEVGPGLSVPRLNIIIINEKGEEETISARLGRGSSITNKFVDYLKSLQGSDKKLIFKDNDSDDNVAEVIRGPKGEFMGIASGTKDIDYVRDYNTGLTFQKEAKQRKYGMVHNNDDTVTMVLLNEDQKPTRHKKTYPNAKAAEAAWLESANQPVDVVGVRWEAQTDIAEFENVPKTIEMTKGVPESKDEPIIVRRFSKNPNIRETVVVKLKHRHTGTYRAVFTNHLDLIIKKLTQDFGSLKDAKAYIGAIEATYDESDL
jgi:hypothetical protein